MNNKDTSVWRERMSRMNKEAIIEVLSDVIEIRGVYSSWYWEQKNMNYGLRAVAEDAVRELQRILDTGDTYGTKELIENYKSIITPNKQPDE